MKILTARRLGEVLRYVPATGQFWWLVSLSSKRASGSKAGWLTKRGCICIGVDGREHKAHHLAWLAMTGSWPRQEIDHIDGDSTNNHWSNLRDVSHRTNSENERKPRTTNALGIKGVSKHGRRYRAQITVAGDHRLIGSYETPEEASAAYLSEKRKVHAGCTI